MKRLLLLIMITSSYITLFAQTEREPSQEFSLLKKSYLTASKEKKTSKQLKELANRIDEFLSHVKIEKSSETCHNMIPYLTCTYDNYPLTIPACLKSSSQVDTILFQDGRWYLPDNIAEDIEIDILAHGMDINSKTAKKIMKTIENKHRFKIEECFLNKGDSVFFVKDENLYYVAIESKKIPTFDILSNNGVINYASCLKAILKASDINVTYDEIIRNYLCTTIDERFVPAVNTSNILAGRKVVTELIPQTNLDVTALVNELIKERFLITIDQNGNLGLLTAIAMTGETDYQPVYVRIRMPMMTGQEEQRVQMSWNDFYNHLFALMKVRIF